MDTAMGFLLGQNTEARLEGGIESVGKFDNFGKIWKTTPFKI